MSTEPRALYFLRLVDSAGDGVIERVVMHGDIFRGLPPAEQEQLIVDTHAVLEFQHRRMLELQEIRDTRDTLAAIGELPFSTVVSHPDLGRFIESGVRIDVALEQLFQGLLAEREGLARNVQWFLRVGRTAAADLRIGAELLENLMAYMNKVARACAAQNLAKMKGQGSRLESAVKALEERLKPILGGA